MSSRAAVSSASTRTTEPTGTRGIILASSMTGIGQRSPSAFTVRSPSAPAPAPRRRGSTAAAWPSLAEPPLATSSPAASSPAPPSPTPALAVAETAGAVSWSRTPATAPGSTSRNRSTSASVVPRGRDSRTFPSDSTPMARSTWLGVSVEEVQEEPEETENPARSSACSSASPST